MSPASSTTPPERPGKVIALHLNYPSRAKQRGRTPAKPSYFVKPTTSISTSGTPIERPAGTELLAFEGEIALIIGKQARRVTPDQGWDHVESITAANDFGVYDLRHADGGSNLRSKGGDGFTPLGPATIPAAEVDPAKLRVRTWVNGEIVQDDTTEDLIFDFGTLVADLSQLSTLEPGDVILTGTPAGSSVVKPGDTVEVEVSYGAKSTGRLVTPVIEGTTPLPEFSAQPKIDDNQREQAYGDRESAGLPAEFVLTEELKTKLTSVGTATLSAQLRKNGYNHVSIDGLGSTRPDTKLIGRARTLRYVPFREDLFKSHGGGFNAQKRAIDSLNPGDVLVMEARG